MASVCLKGWDLGPALSSWDFSRFSFFSVTAVWWHFRTQVTKSGPAGQIQLVEFWMAHEQHMVTTFQNAWKIILKNIVDT